MANSLATLPEAQGEVPELHLLWRPYPSEMRPPNMDRAGQAATLFNGSNVLFFGGCAHRQCHDDLTVLRLRSSQWRRASSAGFGAQNGPSARRGALLVASGRWAWLIGGAAPDAQPLLVAPLVEVFKLDLAPQSSRSDGELMWLRPSIAGRPPPSVETVAGAWVGTSVYTIGGCCAAGCHMAVHALGTAVQHGRHAWRVVAPRGEPPAPRGGHCVVRSRALGGLLVLGGCDRERCFDEAWLLKTGGGAGVAGGSNTSEAAWRQLRPGGLAHSPGGVRGHACVSHRSWVVVHGGVDLAGHASAAVHVLRADEGTPGRSGLLAVAPRWAAVRVAGGAPRPRAFHVAVRVDLGGGAAGELAAGAAAAAAPGGATEAPPPGMVVLGGCAPLPPAADADANASGAAELWVGGAGAAEQCAADAWQLDLSMRCAPGCGMPHGRCVSWRCECADGFGGADGACSEDLRCSRRCSGRGACVDARCSCAAGWLGDDCAVDARCGAECLKYGACHGEACVCPAGWGGADCGDDLRCPARCSERGACVGARCSCDLGFGGAACEVDLRCEGGTTPCHGHGACVRAACACDAGWGGADCAEWVRCPACAPHGRCVPPGLCACDAGWSGATCAAPVCASSGCAHGTCAAPAVCECDAGWTAAAAPAAAASAAAAAAAAAAPTALVPGGPGGGGAGGGAGACDVAVCALYGCAQGTGRCAEPEACACADGWQGFDCSVRSAAGASLWELLLDTAPETLAAAEADNATGLRPLPSLEPALRPTSAAAQLQVPLRRGWRREPAASARRWREAARAANWRAWRGLAPRWWLEVAEWRPIDFAVACEAPRLAARLLRAGGEVSGVTRGLASAAQREVEARLRDLRQGPARQESRREVAARQRAAAIGALLRPPRVPALGLVRASDHALRLRWVRSAAATEYELQVVQLSTRLSPAREWTVALPNALPRGAAARGASADEEVVVAHTLEQLRMNQPFVLTLRARNALGWGNASTALLVSTSAKGQPALLALVLAGVLLALGLGAAAVFTARPRRYRWKRLTLPRARADGDSEALRLLVINEDDGCQDELGD